MRYRIVFAAGAAAGFVLGARAGRERYEQLKRLARKAADNPSVQQAAAAAQAQATEFARTAKGRVTERVPKMADTARGKLGDKLPGSRSHEPGGPAPDGQPYVGSPEGPQP